MKKKIKVHIADDHQILVDGLKAVLSSEENINIVGFSYTGKEVLKWFENNNADVLILDINMPELDGIDVLKEFKARNFQQKIIVLSSYDDTKLIKEVLKMGALGFISKKSAAENIVEAIISVNNNKQYFSKSISEKLLATFSNISVIQPKEDTSYNKLTPREIDVLQLVAKEFSSKEISEKLHISLNTVETHRKNLISKLKVKNVVGLVLYAIKNNII